MITVCDKLVDTIFPNYWQKYIGGSLAGYIITNTGRILDGKSIKFTNILPCVVLYNDGVIICTFNILETIAVYIASTSWVTCKEEYPGRVYTALPAYI